MSGNSSVQPAVPSSSLVVSNSSPLIALDRIGKLGLLKELFGEVSVPSAVVREIGPSIAARPWLLQRAMSSSANLSVLRLSLGAGESEAIELAFELRPQCLILDDRPARRMAQGLGLPVIGTLGILLGAKRRGLLPLIRPELEALRLNGFHVASFLWTQVLADAGE
jgi:uncharacterized protein